MDVIQIREEVRSYLASHSKSQEELAAEMGVSPSWLNKFLRGRMNNLGAERLHSMHQWVKRDQKKSSRG